MIKKCPKGDLNPLHTPANTGPAAPSSKFPGLPSATWRYRSRLVCQQVGHVPPDPQAVRNVLATPFCQPYRAEPRATITGPLLVGVSVRG